MYVKSLAFGWIHVEHRKLFPLGTTRRVIQNPKLCPCISRTVIESASDFFTGRLTKKERKGTIASEVLSDLSLAGYRNFHLHSPPHNQNLESSIVQLNISIATVNDLINCDTLTK
ncbi:hypothetical protein CMV_002296 [Castanea mollissima]|uniref:Fcf2 pre-rRNA processing C-terminal domain-containing protein n=1 Tax=Castanea mollissima TaxID=60419 RepID=A0A8J4VXM9_9ROSI|nr:hypothetical protein CMV_002296 [Castanea mollissima]